MHRSPTTSSHKKHQQQVTMASDPHLPKATDCKTENEGHAQADSHQQVGPSLRSVKTSTDSKKWKQQYKSLLADFQDQQEDLEKVKDELSDTQHLLSEEKAQRRQTNAMYADLKEDLRSRIDDREKLYEECVKVKQLLASRDQNIASLVGQVNLLIQVGSMKRSDGESTTDASSEQSRSRSNRSLLSSETGSIISGSNRSLLSSDIGSSISSLGSFFIAPRRPSSMDRKTETHDTNKESLKTSLTSVGQSRFDKRGPNAAKRRIWSETMKLSDEVLPSQPRRVSAEILPSQPRRVPVPSIYY
jgi:chromosome segregation ATPase